MGVCESESPKYLGPKICLGTWAWGNDGTFGNNLSEKDLKDLFELAMNKGLNIWDTAYVYGKGTSEKILSSFIKKYPRNLYIISDKFTPQCINKSSPNPVKEMIEKQLILMGLKKFDIYWIHNNDDFPKWIEELAKYFEGKKNEEIPLIGVSNHDLAEIKQAKYILNNHKLKLSAVQNHYSIINRSSEYSGILEYCKENKIIFYSYMILEQGALTGKYNRNNLMPQNSERGKIYNPQIEKFEKLNSKIKVYADKYNAKIAQILIAWAINKGTLPIIGVTKKEQINDVINATKINLKDEEIVTIERYADMLEIDVIRSWEKEMQ